MRIALVATLALAALWLAVLRPQAVVEEAPLPTPVETATEAPGAARDTVAGANAESARRESAGETPAAPSAEQAAPASAPVTRTPPAQGEQGARPGADGSVEAARADARAVIADVEAGRVTVLLFWDRRSSDDGAAYDAVTGLDRHDGAVRVHVADIERLGEYERVVRDLPVQQAPSVVVIDRQRTARVINGITVSREIDEAVDRALRGGRPAASAG